MSSGSSAPQESYRKVIGFRLRKRKAMVVARLTTRPVASSHARPDEALSLANRALVGARVRQKTLFSRKSRVSVFSPGPPLPWWPVGLTCVAVI